MLIRIINRRVSFSISGLKSQLQNFFISPAVYGRSFIQSPVSQRIRCFLNASQFSRFARSEAQVALFDYLHYTRAFPSTDAEHISKNSPQFLQYLLSKVDNEQEVSLALSKFFLYNPINEFEPFLESLGLSPSEVASFLPRNLMFLGDDNVMLENFKVLCDFGIPRSKIGKMYKEANEIFRFADGVLATKLRAYEELGLSRSTVIKLVMCCPSLFVGGVNTAFAGVLEKLNRLGLGKDWIGGYLSERSTYSWKSMLDTMNFLAEVGYSEMQAGILFKTTPAFLFEGLGRRLYVLVCRLLKLGLNMNQVHALFLHNPQILSVKCADNFWKAVYFLVEIGMDSEAIAKIVTTHTQILGSHRLKALKSILKNLRIDRDTLCQIIDEDPSKWISLASKAYETIKHAELQSPSNLFEKTSFLLRLGYVENSEEMAKALKQFEGRGDQLQERFDCLIQAGLDYNAASSMVKHAPWILDQTKDTLEKKIGYLRSWSGPLGYPLESMVAFPSYLNYDIGRINLRFSMYLWLRQRGAVKPKLRLSTLLACSDTRFVKNFVDAHPEGPVMWENLKKSFPSNQKTILAAQSGSHLLKASNTVLKNLKVDGDAILQTTEEEPLKLITFPDLQKPSKVFEKTTFLLRLGYVENSEEMVKALKQFVGRGDQLQERFDFLVQAGLDYNDVSSMVKRSPRLLNQTKDMLEKKIDCLRRWFGPLRYPLDSIVKFPSYFCYDIKRIYLRCSMYVWLRQRGAGKQKLHLSTLIASSDARFVKYFVDKHPEGPVMWDNLKNCRIMEDDPLNFISLASISNESIILSELQNPSNILDKTTFLLRLGYVEHSDEMAKALKQIEGRGDQLQERFDFLVQAGLERNVVSGMIKRSPWVLSQTKNMLEKKIDFLKSCLGYPLESIVAFPSYLAYSIERIKIRFSMYVWLRQRGAVKPNLKLSTLIASPDARFVKHFVDAHPEGPAMWENIKESLPLR